MVNALNGGILIHPDKMQGILDSLPALWRVYPECEIREVDLPLPVLSSKSRRNGIFDLLLRSSGLYDFRALTLRHDVYFFYFHTTASVGTPVSYHPMA
ncbi:hypothetical protein V2G26_020377 [Clonostachys chloroleuca]